MAPLRGLPVDKPASAFFCPKFLFDSRLKRCYNDIKTTLLMIGDDKMVSKTGKKRVGIVINSSVYDKLKFVAARYGMTVNSLMAYVLGQWADSFYQKEKVADEVLAESKKILSQLVEREIKKSSDN